MFESCVEIRGHFSDYVDGVCSRDAVRSIRYHLRDCQPCRRELDAWQRLGADLRSLPRRHAPPELDLRLRVWLSHEVHRNVFRRWLVRFQNWVQPVLLPGSVGVLMAVVAIGLIMGSQAVPKTHTPDVPLVTPPRLETLAPLDLDIGDQSVVLVTHVDAEGRVLDYRILSGPRSPELQQRLDRLMYFSQFRPATMSGEPTAGRVVLALNRITVRG